MPKWDIHNKYAEEMGISEEVSEFVNRLIDFPDEIEDYRKAKYEIYSSLGFELYDKDYFGHDSGRKTGVDVVQIKFLRDSFENDEDYVKAWFLHHALDYMNKVLVYPHISFEDSLEKFESKAVGCEESEEVMKFLRDSKVSILDDLGFSEELSEGGEKCGRRRLGK